MKTFTDNQISNFFGFSRQTISNLRKSTDPHDRRKFLSYIILLNLDFISNQNLSHDNKILIMDSFISQFVFSENGLFL